MLSYVPPPAHSHACTHTHTHTQFERFDQVDGRISEYDFAKFILNYSMVSEQRTKKYLARMKKAYGKELSDDPENPVRWLTSSVLRTVNVQS